MGTADYAVYGEVRASSGVSTLFRFTGEQFDAGTGFTFLRARYLNPALGRFISADSVQPNAPGTQGWNLYAYVANNPTTWVDPSGHAVAVATRGGVGAATGISLAALFMEWATNPMTWGVITACAVSIEGCGLAFGAAAAMTAQENRFGVLPWAQLGMLGLVCAISSTFDHIPGKGIEWSGCLGLALKISAVVGEYASTAIEGAWEWWNGPDPKEVFERLKNAAKHWPKIIIGTITAVLTQTGDGTKSRTCKDVPDSIPAKRMKHIMDEHSPANQTFFRNGGPKSWFYSSDEDTVERIIDHGILLGIGKWRKTITGRDGCLVHQSLFPNIGWDTTGMPTNCLRVVTGSTQAPWLVWTAYPVRWDQC